VTRRRGKRECSKVIGLSEGLGLGECDREVSESESREREREKMNREGAILARKSQREGKRETRREGTVGQKIRGVIAAINERETDERERRRR
jgi:hypothetical protein